MTALFPRVANTVVRAVLIAVACVGIGIPIGLMAWVRTPNATGRYAPVAQPVPFSHQLHAGRLEIDCRYCHFSVERSASAGMPPTTTCVPCHNAVWRESRELAPVRASLASGKPIAWRRVNRLPDFVYFNHAAHVNGGVACESCHGQVEKMQQLAQTAPLSMAWCVECHKERAPPRFTACTTCHR